jgi:hypothetical protein
MAVKVLSEEKIEDVGMNLTNFVITIKGRVEIYKQSDNTYNCITYANYYSSEQAYLDGKVPFIKDKQIALILQASDLSGNIFELVYNNIKSGYQSTIDI